MANGDAIHHDAPVDSARVGKGRRQLAWMLITGLLTACLAQQLTIEHASAQHEFQSTLSPPGEVGQLRMMRRTALHNHFQPVKVFVPEGAQVSVFNGAGFQTVGRTTALMGLRVGDVYRLKITHIPNQEGFELFPSVELIDRLYPPYGKELRFPVEVHFTAEEIRKALDGHFVTRVVYLEDPATALPAEQPPNYQPFIDVEGRLDPLKVATKLGRSIAIVRLGSRVPTAEDIHFGFASPPLMVYPQPPADNVVFPQNARKQLQRTDRPKTGDIDPPIVSVVDDPRKRDQPGRGESIVRSFLLDSTPKSDSILQVSHSSSETRQENETGGQSEPSASDQATVDPPVFHDRQEYVPRIDDSCCPAPTMAQSSALDCTAGPPDEYLYDGGDRQEKVRVGTDWGISGLNDEDTIAHFDTLDGRRIVQPSNCVAIYSPRFSAVRRISGFGRAISHDYMVTTRDNLPPMIGEGKDITSTTLQHLQPARHHLNNFPSSFRDRTRGVLVDNTIKLDGYIGKLKPHEAISLIETGQINWSDKARLAIGMAAAQVWNDVISAQSTDQSVNVVIVTDVNQAKEIVHARVEGGNPTLRLVKIASTSCAQPGEVVQFTLRFDNLGNERIGNVTIIDELTARLEYVDGTAQSSVESAFSAKDNTSGSQTLRWEIDQPLDPGEGGIIRFDCRVR